MVLKDTLLSLYLQLEKLPWRFSLGQLEFELFLQNLEHIGCDKGGLNSSQTDPLHNKSEEAAEYGYRLLLEPGEGDRKWEFVDPAIESFRQMKRNLNGAVVVVAYRVITIIKSQNRIVLDVL